MDSDESIEEAVSKYGRTVYIYTWRMGKLAFVFELDQESIHEEGKDPREFGYHLAQNHPEARAVREMGGGGHWGWSGGEYVYRIWKRAE